MWYKRGVMCLNMRRGATCGPSFSAVEDTDAIAHSRMPAVLHVVPWLCPNGLIMASTIREMLEALEKVDRELKEEEERRKREEEVRIRWQPIASGNIMECMGLEIRQ
jgi:hypothetical protein